MLTTKYTIEPTSFKTEKQNRMYPVCVSSSAFTGKEKDEETGYGYFGARYMDHELMTMWLSVDPMANKYPSISPYAYCAWNPVKLVDPDGLTPRIYVETEGFGHAFVSVEVNGNLIVYTYGRYAGGDKHKHVSGDTDPTGKGVLIRLTGDAAQQYINHEVKDNHASAYEFNDASNEKVMQYYDNLFSSGTKLNPHDASRYDDNPLNYGTSDDARVINKYFLFGNNCVTTLIIGIQKGGSKIPFKKLLGNFLVPEKNIISPSELKVYLEMVAKFSQSVKKIEPPDTISGAN